MKTKRYIVIIAFVVVAAGIICGVLLLMNRRAGEGETSQAAYEEITMILPTYGYVPEHMDEVVEAMNEVSIRKVGVKVNYIYVGSTELNHSCLMRLKAGETIDLMPVLENDGLTTLMEEKLLAPLNELLMTYAPEIIELTYPKIWDALGAEGDIYAITVGGRLSDWAGLILMKDVADAAGIDPDAIVAAIQETAQEDNIRKIDATITPVLEYCHNSEAQLPDGAWVSEKQLIPGLNSYGTVFSQMPVVDHDGYGNPFGVTLGNSDRIVNLFETEEYKKEIELLKQWEEKGYIYHLQSTIDEDPAVVYDRKDALGFFSSLGLLDVVPGKAIDREDKIYFPFIKNKLTSDFFRVGTWVIPETAEHQESAMKILKLMYSDEEYMRTYHGEVEGVAGYRAPLAWLFGNSILVNEDYEAALEEKNAFTEMEFSRYFGFIYRAGDKKDIITRLELILDEYLPLIENGIVDDVEATLQEMNDKLYAAGLQEIMDDKQRQLDAWIADRTGR